MDQVTAKRLFLEGGTFIFLDVPEGTEFGIDMKSWNTGEKFRGVKMIPPGLHYIFYSSVGRTGDTAPRIGFFHSFHKAEVLVKRWNQLDEEVSLVDVEETEVVQLKENMVMLDTFLGPYPYDIQSRWTSLSSNLTESLVSRLTPESGTIRSALELESCTDSNRPRNNENSPSTSKRVRLSCTEETEESLLPKLTPKAGTELRVSKFPEKNYPENSTAAEITKHSLDLTHSLTAMIANYERSTDILGEMEFSYICFLVGHSFEAFDHWKRLVSLLCSCESGIRKYRHIYDSLFTILEIQVREIPEEFLADIVSNRNVVYVKLRDLFRATANADVDGVLKSKAERLKRQLTENYLWDFSHLESDEEDEAPVIVDSEGC